MTANTPKVSSTRGLVRPARAIVAAEADDTAEFGRLVENAIVTDCDAVLREALALIPANGREDAEQFFNMRAETLPLKDNQIARLIALPVLVHNDGLATPASRDILAALQFSGLVPDFANIEVEPCYWDAAALKALSWSGRRRFLDDLTSGVRPESLLLNPVKATWHGRRGMQAVIMVSLILPEDEEIALFDADEPLDFELRWLQEAVLRTGTGLVDMAQPVALYDLATAGTPESPWLVESCGAMSEVSAFFASAADALGQDQVACTIRRAGPRLEVRLRTNDGALVDGRDFTPFGEYDMPMAMDELRRCITEVAARVEVLPDWDGLADFARERPGYIPPRRPAGVRPVAISGGRILREQEEEAKTYAGMRRRLDELRANSPLKTGGPTSG